MESSAVHGTFRGFRLHRQRSLGAELGQRCRRTRTGSSWEHLCCYNGAHQARMLLQRRDASARQIIARLHELGITAVLPGIFRNRDRKASRPCFPGHN